MHNKNLKKLAQQLTKELHKDLGITNLESYLRTQGWEIYDYDQQLIDSLHLQDMVHKREAFYCCNNGLKIVFANKQHLSQSAYRLALLHEIAHIALEHHLQEPVGCDYSALAEYEAETLAIEIQRLCQKRNNWPLITCGIIIISLSLALALAMLPPDQLQNSAQALPGRDPATQDQSLPSTEQYYITAFGYRYHISDCYHIKDRDTTPVSKADAIAQGYTPCKDCIEEN